MSFSRAPNSLAVVLMAAALVLTAGAIPALGSYSPVDGVADVRDSTDAGDGGAAGGGAGESGPQTRGSGAPVGEAAGGGPSLEGLGALGRLLGYFAGLLGIDGGSALGGEFGAASSRWAAPSLSPGAGGLGGGGGGSGASTDGLSAGGSLGGEGESGADDGSGDGGESGAEDRSPAADESAVEDAADPGADGLGTTLPAVGAGLTLLALFGYLYRSDRAVLAAIRALPRRLKALVVTLCFAVSGAVEALAGIVRDAASVVQIPRRVAAAVVGWFRSVGRRAYAFVPRRGGAASVADGATSDGDGDGAATDRERIRSAWKIVVDAVPVRRPRRTTAAEVESVALERGLPEDPVRSIADSFRDVEYGSRDPTGRVGPATTAAAELRAFLERGGPDDGDGSERNAGGEAK